MYQLRLALPLVSVLFSASSIGFAGSGENLAKSAQVQKVDLVELNHRYDDQGRHCYDQVIFYEWSPDYRRYHVVAWCMVDNGLSQLPTLDRTRNNYVVRWTDRETGRNREIWAPVYRETWSDWDPEHANKKLMDEKYRVSLFRQTVRPPVR